MISVICQDDQRRERVRAETALNGLDYLEVSGDQLGLTVYFIGKAPEALTDQNCTDHFRIEGGRRVRDIEVVGGKVRRDLDPELDDWVTLKLNRYGDFSIYRLRLVDVQEWLDPHFDHLDFSFKVDCPSDLDCRTEEVCPPEPRVEPEINYLAKDYASFRQLILDRLALLMPDWQERRVPDLGIALVELLAYTGDHLSYYQDAVATEAYLDTARQRESVRRHARLVDYFMHEGCNARAWVCLEMAEGTKPVPVDPTNVLFVTNLKDVLPMAGPVLAHHELGGVPAHHYKVFEPLMAKQQAEAQDTLEFRHAHNSISFYTWGERECCLPRGATSASLLEDALDLKPGDVLLLEEVIGPRTGNPADADPTHRHAIRLTQVEPQVDPLDNTPVLEIAWSDEDALPFPLCLSAITDAEHGCVYNDGVSVAHGNVLLVDHGETSIPPEDLGTVPTDYTQEECECEGHPGEVTQVPGRFAPRLAGTPLTFSQPVDLEGSASRTMLQNPRKALPLVDLASLPGGHKWSARFDLLGSGADERHFAVEIDNERRARLRFGDGECGRAPKAGTQFSAEYRMGNGKAGNVGAEAIAHLVYRQQKPDGIEGVRNPLPAQDGTDPEPISEVKLFAPSAFRKQLQRAITADDYARIAERNSKVQRAAAELRWTGSWYEMQVAIDPLGSEEASEELLREIEQDLYPFRRIGYDLRVVPANYVSLHIAMDVCVDSDYLRGHVKAALLALFSSRNLPDGTSGFFHPDKLTFGEGIYLSRIVAAAQAIDGVENVRVTRLQRQFEQRSHELENGVLPLGPLEVGRCDNDPDFPEHGRFELNVVGGR